jgi:hypothetical protein
VRDPNLCAALLSLTVNQPTQPNLRKIEALQTEIARLEGGGITGQTLSSSAPIA